ncbi:hypothetical protein BDL97_06G074900 [Sphagnum fallax]|nr:hypothetical protein BDL97_06G074900 [Sphagnum fallax]
MTATGLTAYTTLLTSATANAAVFGMLMSVAAVGAFMALFFTSLTVIYSVTLAVTTFATGTVLFLSMSAALIVAVAREFWEGLIKIFELAMSAIAMIGSALATISAAGKTQIITVQKHPPH